MARSVSQAIAIARRHPRRGRGRVFPRLRRSLALRDTGAVPAPGPDERDWSDDVPAHCAIVDGAASSSATGTVEPAEENVPLLAGDRLRTERGRVEVLFADGSALDVDEYTRVDLLSDSLIRLLDGRVRLSIARATSTLDYRVDAPAGSVVDRDRRRLSHRASAAAGGRSGTAGRRCCADRRNSTTLTAARSCAPGMEALARRSSSRRRSPYAFNVGHGDAFDRWVERFTPSGSAHSRRAVSAAGAATTTAASFDSNGSWDYLPSYGGYVWYPRVAVGWRPYSVGTLVGLRELRVVLGRRGRWAWPTHHYGRWGLAANRWYWVPDRRWAPAWVSWGGAPGYVSWCPLGYNGYPVVGFSAGVGVGRYSDPWSAWTVVPSRVFVPNVRGVALCA